MMKLSLRKAASVCWRAAASFVFVCTLVAMLVHPAYAAAAPSHSAPATTPTSKVAASPASTATPPKDCNPKAGRCPAVAPNLYTGEYAHGKPSMSYCNGRMYVAWTGADDHINIAWGSTGGPFPSNQKATFTDTTYYNMSTNPQTFTGPSIVCWQPLNGPYSDAERLWVVWTGTTNKLIYYAYYDGKTTGTGVELQARQTIPGQSSVLSPATAVYARGLYVTWRGNTNKNLSLGDSNDIEATQSQSVWHNDGYFPGQTSFGGPGLAVWKAPFQDYNQLWIAWIGTNSGNNIYTGYYDFAGNWTYKGKLSDFSGVNDDLTLVPDGGTLYCLYAGVAALFNDLNVDKTTDGTSWDDGQSVYTCVYGASGAILYPHHLWVVWTAADDTQVLLEQWN